MFLKLYKSNDRSFDFTNPILRVSKKSCSIEEQLESNGEYDLTVRLGFVPECHAPDNLGCGLYRLPPISYGGGRFSFEITRIARNEVRIRFNGEKCRAPLIKKESYTRKDYEMLEDGIWDNRIPDSIRDDVLSRVSCSPEDIEVLVRGLDGCIVCYEYVTGTDCLAYEYHLVG